MVPDPLGPGVVEVLRTSDLFGPERPPRRGKVRDVYDLGDEMLILTTDRVSAFDVVYPTLIPHKGESLHALSVYWFERTASLFPNHFQESVDVRTMRVLKAERIDIEWVCRAYLYGSAWRAYRDGARRISGVELPDRLEMADELPEVILTPTTKSETGHDLELTKAEAIDAGLVTPDEWRELEEATYRLFEFYRSEARRRGIIIPDFKLEFGRHRGRLIQIDEPPTHDSARFWAEELYEPGRPQEDRCLDKEFLREYLRRIGYTGDGAPPEIAAPVVREVSKRCVASYEVLSGRRRLADFELRTVDDVMDELMS
ncbi:MAG: phosphoribosylaminoimidazolesuccinocarboxamide synthase [Candidatus Bathyarchaeia archaeon]